MSLNLRSDYYNRDSSYKKKLPSNVNFQVTQSNKADPSKFKTLPTIKEFLSDKPDNLSNKTAQAYEAFLGTDPLLPVYKK